MRLARWNLTWCVLISVVGTSADAGDAKYLSHRPMRPLPTASQRPKEPGPAFFASAVKGDDTNDGSEAKPWKTLQHAVQKLRPGDTLYVRGGTYYEHVTVTVSGTAEKPITIRSFPGELAILDGGLREFFEQPAQAWEPFVGGAKGEFRSTKAYPDLGGTEDSTNVLGNFGDSLVPLHGYRFLRDLRDTSAYWDIKNRLSDKEAVYCGPGIFYDVKTGRIHARLAHTNLPGLREDNYTGETDPRSLPLIIAGQKGGSPLVLRGTRHLRLQDLVIRGSLMASVAVTDGANLIFDGLTVYGGASCFQIKDTHGVRLLHTACRGIAGPWTFRGSLKYRAFEARVFSASGWTPTGADNRDFELAYSEFTDCVDGIFIGNVAKVRLHHNLVENISDDAIFLTAGTAYDGTTPGGDVHIYQNYLSRCLTTLAFGVGHGRQKALPDRLQTGSGAYIHRNVFDLRRPVMYHQPASPEGPQEITSPGRIASDHGSPAWEPLMYYHNTIIAADQGGYSYGALGLGDHVGSGTRRVFNNIVVQIQGLPGTYLPEAKIDFQADGNLHWSTTKGAKLAGDPFAKFRQSKAFELSKNNYTPGWTAQDRFADAKFNRFDVDWRKPLDLSLRSGSPAIAAGVALPDEWPEPIAKSDTTKPDIGALPLGAKPWNVGANGRLTMFGEPQKRAGSLVFEPLKFADRVEVVKSKHLPAAIVEGYPEFDALLIDFCLRRQGVIVERLERAWLDSRKYANYSTVVIAGDLLRAGVEPNKYSAADLEAVRKFLSDGGTLWLCRRGKRVFDHSPEGQKFLGGLTGQREPEKDGSMTIALARHPWVSHLALYDPHPWLKTPLDRDTAPLRPKQGERIIATTGGTTSLYRLPVGKGQFIYMGWQVHDSLPHTRAKAAAVEQERIYEEQFRILMNIAADIYPAVK